MRILLQCHSSMISTMIDSLRAIGTFQDSLLFHDMYIVCRARTTAAENFKIENTSATHSPNSLYTLKAHLHHTPLPPIPPCKHITLSRPLCLTARSSTCPVPPRPSETPQNQPYSVNTLLEQPQGDGKPAANFFAPVCHGQGILLCAVKNSARR